ncbi:hypothetical protein FHS86_002878 [Roseimarinus sediminis]
MAYPLSFWIFKIKDHTTTVAVIIIENRLPAQTESYPIGQNEIIRSAKVKLLGGVR